MGNQQSRRPRKGTRAEQCEEEEGSFDLQGAPLTEEEEKAHQFRPISLMLIGGAQTGKKRLQSAIANPGRYKGKGPSASVPATARQFRSVFPVGGREEEKRTHPDHDPSPRDDDDDADGVGSSFQISGVVSQKTRITLLRVPSTMITNAHWGNTKRGAQGVLYGIILVAAADDKASFSEISQWCSIIKSKSVFDLKALPFVEEEGDSFASPPTQTRPLIGNEGGDREARSERENSDISPNNEHELNEPQQQQQQGADEGNKKKAHPSNNGERMLRPAMTLFINKCDVCECPLSDDELDAFCAENGIEDGWYEVSAETEDMVEESLASFFTTVEHLYSSCVEDSTVSPPSGRMRRHMHRRKKY